MTTFYVTGGTLRSDAPSYVERGADRELLEGLSQGEFCYVLTSRQMGKSSLMVRTANALKERQAHVVVLDLTAIGQNVTPEQWYDGMMVRMGRQLGMEEALENYWRDQARLGPVQRFFGAIREVVLKHRPGALVIFVDESDTVRSLTFSTDEFFAAIREAYNRRSEDPELKRLTFCLLGVATPSDLVQDTRLTPFNIGRRIDVQDFSEAEALPLAKGLAGNGTAAAAMLRRVLHWTGGHPYLTQRLCLAVAEDAEAQGAGDVDRHCERLFLAAGARERDDNLIFVRERMLKSEVDTTALLELYDRVRRGRNAADDEAHPTVSVLKLSGIARGQDGRLEIRNRIYGRAFDRKWILRNLPDAERRRQRVAFRRGMAGAVAGVVLLAVLLSLPLFRRQVDTLALTPAGFTNVVLAAGEPGVSIALPAVLTNKAIPFQPSIGLTSVPFRRGIDSTEVTFQTGTGITTVVLPQQTNTVTELSSGCFVVMDFEGNVEIRRAGAAVWDPAFTNLVLYPGDSLRTGDKGQAKVRHQDGTICKLAQRSVLRLPSPDDEQRVTGFEVLKSFFYLFRRGPATNGSMRIITPQVTTKIEG